MILAFINSLAEDIKSLLPDYTIYYIADFATNPTNVELKIVHSSNTNAPTITITYHDLMLELNVNNSYNTCSTKIWTITNPDSIDELMLILKTICTHCSAPETYCPSINNYIGHWGWRLVMPGTQPPTPQ